MRRFQLVVGKLELVLFQVGEGDARDAFGDEAARAGGADLPSA